MELSLRTQICVCSIIDIVEEISEKGLNIVVLPYTPLFFIQGIYTRSVCNNINKVKMKEKTEKMEFVVFRLL